MKTLLAYFLAVFVAPIAAALPTLMASFIPPMRQKGFAIAYEFLTGLVGGAASFWFATVLFHWLDRTPTWWLVVLLAFVFLVFNYGRASRLVGQSDFIHEAIQGVGNCLGVVFAGVILL